VLTAVGERIRRHVEHAHHVDHDDAISDRCR
jgi:hypothetical protein